MCLSQDMLYNISLCKSFRDNVEFSVDIFKAKQPFVYSGAKKKEEFMECASEVALVGRHVTLTCDYNIKKNCVGVLSSMQCNLHV